MYVVEFIVHRTMMSHVSLQITMPHLFKVIVMTLVIISNGFLYNLFVLTLSLYVSLPPFKKDSI